MSLWYVVIPSPIGTLLAVADDRAVCFLQILQDGPIEGAIDAFQKRFGFLVAQKNNELLSLLQDELTQYFQGTLQAFTVPLALDGTAFQKKTWQALRSIPYGQRRSYLQVASSMSNHKATRAVGNANRSNPIMILVPCHRVICHNGQLGGYAGGIDAKKWLLAHEANCRMVD